MSDEPRHITASEIIRRNQGPWTPEEIVYIEAKNKEFHDKVITPILAPILDRTVEIVARLVKK